MANGYNGYDQGRYNTQGLNPYDYSNLGLTILYLVVIVGGVVGNGLFSYVVIKNRNLHRSAHFLLASLAVRDVVVAISVVPFVIDSQVCRDISKCFIGRSKRRLLCRRSTCCSGRRAGPCANCTLS